MAAALKYPKADLIFINYGQRYLFHEYNAAVDFAEAFKRKITTIEMPLEHDIERRNFYFLAEAKRRGHNKVVTGNRNILPFFDKYQDSNWLALTTFAGLMNMEIKTPVVGWSKKRIVEYVRKHYQGSVYNCYESKTDYKTCDCVNCKELRKIL